MEAPAQPAVDVARLFLALWPDAPTLRRLQAHQDDWRWGAGALRVAPRRLHLTLHFIGHVPRNRVAGLAAALDVAFESFPLVFGVPHGWPRGLAVVCPRDVPEPLVRLHAALADALRSSGLPVEPRDFRPHVTLARKATGAVPPVNAPRFRWPVGGYALMESVPGADYRRVRWYGARPASNPLL